MRWICAIVAVAVAVGVGADETPMQVHLEKFCQQMNMAPCPPGSATPCCSAPSSPSSAPRSRPAPPSQKSLQFFCRHIEMIPCPVGSPHPCCPAPEELKKHWEARSTARVSAGERVRSVKRFCARMAMTPCPPGSPHPCCTNGNDARARDAKPDEESLEYFCGRMGKVPCGPNGKVPCCDRETGGGGGGGDGMGPDVNGAPQHEENDNDENERRGGYSLAGVAGEAKSLQRAVDTLASVVDEKQEELENGQLAVHGRHLGLTEPLREEKTKIRNIVKALRALRRVRSHHRYSSTAGERKQMTEQMERERVQENMDRERRERNSRNSREALRGEDRRSVESPEERAERRLFEKNQRDRRERG